MKIFDTFGFRSQTIISKNTTTAGKITDVKTCWWIKVNTKPVRLHALDGAIFPHMIYFTYFVDGAEYRGRRYVSCYLRCPQIHEKITIFYDPDRPAKYAVNLTGTSLKQSAW